MITKAIKILKERSKILNEEMENNYDAGYNKGYEICIKDLELIKQGQLK